MSSAKRGTAADDFYSEHLFGAGGRFNRNPAAQRESSIAKMVGKTITQVATSRFKWSNLPDSIDPRFLEMCLYYNALCVVYWDRDYDQLLAVRGTGTGFVNMLDNPVSFTVIGPGTLLKPTTDTAPAQFRQKIIPAYMGAAKKVAEPEDLKQKAVPIWANPVRYPDLDIVQIYSTRLAMMDRTIEINVKNARRPRILKGTDNTQLSRVNANNAIDKGEELLQVTGALEDMQWIDTLDLGIDPVSFEKLHILRTRTWNEAMSMLGVNGANQDKKERLVSAEVDANDEQILAIRNAALKSRQEAVEIINDIFGLEIEVAWNIEVEEMAKTLARQALGIDTESEGGSDNGNVHDGPDGSDR